MFEKYRSLRFAAVIALVVAITACGGGSSDPVDQPVSAASVNLDNRNLFTLSAGDRWVYDVKEDGRISQGAVARTVVSGPNATGDVVVREMQGGDSEDINYRSTPEGVVLLDPLGAQGLLPGLHEAFPSYLIYPSTPYSVGVTRSTKKSGALGIDWDGDGRNDNFKAEESQVFRGFETITVLGVATEAAHFTNKYEVTLASVTFTFTEEAFFASNLGLVRSVRSGMRSDNGARYTYTLELREATVGGRTQSSASALVDRNAVEVSSSRLQSSSDLTQESVTISTADLTGQETYISTSHTSKAIAAVVETRLSSTKTRLDIQFVSASSLPLGQYDDTIQVQICYDVGCTAPISSSPIIISTSYTVTDDAPEEPGVDRLTVLSRKALAHNVVDAEFSKSLNAIVMVSSWPQNALHVYNMTTGIEKQVLLVKAPTAVSVSPDGTTAAVGHDALISHVDLSTVGLASAAAPKQLNVSTNVFDLVLDGHGQVHAMPAADQWESLHSVNIATNTEALVDWRLYAGAHGKLSTAVDAIYTADNGLSPSDIAKWKLDGSGQASYMGDSPYHGDYAMCGNLWMSEDGITIYTSCGNTFRASNTTGQDMIYSGALALSPAVYGYRILSLSESSALKEVALIEAEAYNCQILNNNAGCYNHLNLYASQSLNQTAKYALGPVAVTGKNYAQRGVAVFHGANGQGLFLISRLAAMPDPGAEYYLSVVR